jgi:sulfonate transport system substrate-binding protein
MSANQVMKIVSLWALPVVLACAAVLAQGPAQAAGARKTLAVTYVKYPLNAPLILAKVMGLYEREFAPDAITVEWADITTGPRQAEAIRDGGVQIASVISSDAVLAAIARGEPIQAVAVFARAPGTFCLMTKSPAVGSVRDLKGKTAAGPRGSLLHLMLLAGLERAGLKPGDVTFVDMPVPQAMAAMLAGNVEAALTAGPGKIRAEAEGARVVSCGEGLTKGILLTAASEKLLREDPGMVRRYLAVHGKALAFLRENPRQASEIIAQETGLTVAEVERLLPEYDFTPGVADSDKQDLNAVQDFLARLGLIVKPVPLERVFWPEAGRP